MLIVLMFYIVTSPQSEVPKRSFYWHSHKYCGQIKDLLITGSSEYISNISQKQTEVACQCYWCKQPVKCAEFLTVRDAIPHLSFLSNFR